MRQRRNRCANYLDQHGFLIDWSANQIIRRLQDIKRQFPNTLQIGCRSKSINKNQFDIKNLYTLDIAENLSPDIQADEESLPFSLESFDLVISALNLHTINDLPGTLAQIKNVLKPDGLFIAALLGGETLYELRSVITDVEIEVNGGISPRVAPFADMPQMGNLMQRAGFNLPVIDSEKLTVTYDHPLKLMQDLRLMGESNTLLSRIKKATGKEFFYRVSEEYMNQFSNKNGRITATFEVIFLIGWAPHKSQQKPLSPGSAQNRLADALQTNEKALPC